MEREWEIEEGKRGGGWKEVKREIKQRKPSFYKLSTNHAMK